MSIQLLGVVLLLGAVMWAGLGVFVKKKYFPGIDKPRTFPMHSVFTWKFVLFGIFSIVWFGVFIGLAITGILFSVTP